MDEFNYNRLIKPRDGRDIWSSFVVKMPHSPSNVMTVRKGLLQVCVKLLYRNTGVQYFGKFHHAQHESLLCKIHIDIRSKWPMSSNGKWFQKNSKHWQIRKQWKSVMWRSVSRHKSLSFALCRQNVYHQRSWCVDICVCIFNFRKPSLRITRSIKLIGLLMPCTPLSESVSSYTCI